MRYSSIFIPLVAIGLYSNVLARPLEAARDKIDCIDKTCPALGSQLDVRTPVEFEPIPEPHEDPDPDPIEPKAPEAPSPGPATAPDNQIGVAKYTPPASYGAFPAKGQQLQDAVGTASGPDNDLGYATKIESYHVMADQQSSLFSADNGLTGNNLRTPFSVVGLQDNDQWTLREIYGADLTEDPSSVVYHSREQQTLVVTDAFNDKLGTGFPEADKLGHSELTFQGWKAAPGGDITKLKYVVVAQLQNDASPAVINDARASVAGTQTAGKEVTFMAASQNDAEQQGFYAIAGTQNGKFLFRMLADHHSELNGLKVVSVHTWANIPGSPDPVLIWELA